MHLLILMCIPHRHIAACHNNTEEPVQMELEFAIKVGEEPVIRGEEPVIMMGRSLS